MITQEQIDKINNFKFQKHSALELLFSRYEWVRRRSKSFWVRSREIDLWFKFDDELFDILNARDILEWEDWRD